MTTATVEANPSAVSFDLATTALVVIDMQRDFLEPGGFGAALGNDVSLLRSAIKPAGAILAAARAAGLLIIHTREGHRADLSDAPPLKVLRGDPAKRIGAPGPMGRILVRGEPGHDIIPELAPARDRSRQARQGRVLCDRSRPHPAQSRHSHAHRLRRDDGSLRAHERARRQRSRISLHRRSRRLRLVFS